MFQEFNLAFKKLLNLQSVKIKILNDTLILTTLIFFDVHMLNFPPAKTFLQSS